jgi:hypothetical protein
MTIRERLISELIDVHNVFVRTVHPEGEYAGWKGRDVLCHLAPFARLASAILRANADQRLPSERELYGRRLTQAERRMTDLDEINQAFQARYLHYNWNDAVTLWEAQNRRLVVQIERLSDEQLEAENVYPPAWARPHLYEVVDAYIAHCRSHVPQ